MSSEPTRTEGGTGALASLLDSLQPALAAAQLRVGRGDGGLPRWFAPAPPAVNGDCIEILALDGAVLFVSDNDALPADHAETVDLQVGFWLRHNNPEARGALALAGRGQTAQFKAMAQTRDGDLVKWDVTVAPMRTDAGEIDALLVVSRHDMSRARDQSLQQREQKLRLREAALDQRAAALDQREASNRQEDAAALRDAMERLELALSAGPVIGTWVWDVQADRVIADARLARAFSVPPDQAASGLPLAHFVGMIHPDDRVWVGDLIAETVRHGGDFRAEYRLVYADRPAHWVQASGRCERDEAGRPLRFPGVLVDVHDRVELQRAAEARAERQAALLALGDRLRDASDATAIAAIAAGVAGRTLGASNVGYADVDPQIGRITVRHDWTDGVSVSIAGTYDSSSVGTALAQLQRGLPIVEEDLWSAAWLDPADRDSYRAMGMRGLVTLPLLRDARLVGTMFVGSAERRVWRPDEVRFVRDVADRTWAAIERVQAEAGLRAGAAELRLVADSMPVLITQLDRSLIFRFCNRASFDWFGLAPEQIVGRAAHDIFEPEDFAWRQPYFQAALAGQPSRVELDWPHPDGAPRVAEIRYLPRRDAQGGYDGFYAFVLDITDHKRAEQQLQGSAEALEAEIVRRTADRDRMWHLSTDVMLVANFDGRIEAVNPAWGALLGWRDNDLLGSDFFGLVHPDDQGATRAKIALLLAGQRIAPLQTRLRHQDGSYRWISWSMVADERSLHAVGRDVTAERERESLQRQLEDQLRQSQKMEAVGQLTGGLAHDFNNLLTGISGSLELLQGRLARGRVDGLDRYIQSAQGSAQRAAALTHRLLAFSRRQTLDPKPTDVNQLIDSLAALIHGTVGPAIEVTTLLGTEVWSTLCDPNQLENALLNLCINARDAMPAGGRLVIETANASLDELAALDNDMAPGDYVAMSVGDTGTGMTAEIAARAFDPFYTTKKLGEGTGLGLSMIYGFVKQSGGQIRVYTEVGRGTTMQLFLPRHQMAPVAEPSPPAVASVLAKRGETVLLVDDEATIRDLVLEVLLELGYDAIAAEDAGAAIAVLESGRRIDLLVSDIGLPGGMNGRELADFARRDHPTLKVLFVTGYAANAVVGNEALSAGMHILTKPFSMNGLAAKIRVVLAEE